VKACPDSQQVLGVVARLLHKLRVSKQAEELYLGALLLDPLSADALRGYALMLAEAGNWQLACKYISRVESHSLSYSAAKTEKGKHLLFIVYELNSGMIIINLCIFFNRLDARMLRRL
jgi:tetratricopeptide (TPR) repeat protein